MYKKKAGNKIKIYGKGYLVKSVFSDQHFSYNTIDYYNKLQQVSKPWYYVFYDYTLCNECYINRINLKNYDRKLYKLHLKATRLWIKYEKFYWLVDDELSNKFSKLWSNHCNDQVYKETI